jgi:hypothetical protein
MIMIHTRKQPFELFDETLDINATDNYDLTIELSDDGIAYSILDLLRGKYVMLRHYQPISSEEDNSFSLQEVLSGDDFLKCHYRRIFIITPSVASTMVPNPLYVNALKDDYYRFNLPTDGNEVIFSNSLTVPAVTVIFSPDSTINELISGKWQGVTPWHHLKPLLQHAFTASRASEEKYIHLHIEKGFITVVVLSDRNLSFCNSFRCSTPSDINYYLFNVMDSMGIRNHESVYLSGVVEPYGELHLSLLEFSHAVHFASPLVKQGFSYVFNEVHLHRYLNLFTAASCE